jgi:hypothetical protein
MVESPVCTLISLLASLSSRIFGRLLLLLPKEEELLMLLIRDDVKEELLGSPPSSVLDALGAALPPGRVSSTEQ